MAGMNKDEQQWGGKNGNINGNILWNWWNHYLGVQVRNPFSSWVLGEPADTITFSLTPTFKKPFYGNLEVIKSTECTENRTEQSCRRVHKPFGCYQTEKQHKPLSPQSEKWICYKVPLSHAVMLSCRIVWVEWERYLYGSTYGWFLCRHIYGKGK